MGGNEVGVSWKALEETGTILHCPLCGHDFSPQEGRTACSLCPLHRGCSLYRCPRCGMEVLPEPAWLGRMRGWWRAWRGKRP